MQSFRDTEGRPWDVHVTVATVARVRRLVGVDLLDIGSEEFIKSLNDPVSLANVLFAVCEPQALQRNISDEQFGESLAGDVLNQASRALMEAIADFFPSETQRKALRRVLEEVQALERMQAEMIESRMVETINELRAAAKKLFGDPSIASPELSASTPDP